MYCCELLSGVGPCTAKRMFGGYGISTSGLTLALVADLGGGDKLWLKADAETRGLYEAQGCERFTYEMTRNGVTAPHSLSYYAAPEEAMESPAVMLPWARVALECALRARAAKAATAPKVKKPKTPKAPAAKTAKMPKAAKTVKAKAKAVKPAKTAKTPKPRTSRA
ncbi:MAG: TfoX/Sxy family protein [Polaromonas sp.]|nr:TfoX/Sxy family protein [Polaromonas sp.]